MQKATKRTVWFMRFRSCKLAFGPPAMVDKRDLAIIKASGLNFSKIQLAQFRSYRPGYLPWFLTAEEASHLVCALTQTLAVASRFITEADVIPFNKDPEDRDYLIRILRFKDPTPFCDDSIVTVDPPPTQLLPFGLDDTTLGKLQEFHRSEAWKLTLLFFPQELEEVMNARV